MQDNQDKDGWRSFQSQHLSIDEKKIFFDPTRKSVSKIIVEYKSLMLFNIKKGGHLRKNGKFELPGGQIDFKEDSIVALSRELSEEDTGGVLKKAFHNALEGGREMEFVKLEVKREPHIL